MFFRKMTEREKKASNKAVCTSFVFLLIALISHAVYGYVQTGELNQSFIILLVGLLVFFLSDLYFRSSSKKKS